METPVKIPNPLYDVVFRYLMEDERVARLMLSAILGETVETLEFQSTEQSGKRRTDLERLLSIFDQASVSDTKGHFLALNSEGLPEAYQPVIRRLQQAMANPELEGKMDLEDEVMQEFQKKEAEIVAVRKLAEREREQKEEAQREKEEAQREKEEAQRQKEEALRREEEAQRRFVRFLADQGQSIEAISQLAGLEEAAVRRLLEEG